MNKKHQEVIDEIKPQHSWDAKETHPDVRCSNCGMKKSYYYDAIHNLKSWPDEDIEAEPFEVWKDKIESYWKCIPR